ncbi:hypothetical protein QBC47DRAFT_49357 [Echria macrotheca]|uniref:Uncharacterized protein n=1 Tax=Echria macrotheca TaxID=438768 RepID=A0AAJ0B9F7_9PEZI|nr:hypothetical protein QBC47DRAFT_49357 [Echria macrotheca]
MLSTPATLALGLLVRAATAGGDAWVVHDTTTVTDTTTVQVTKYVDVTISNTKTEWCTESKTNTIYVTVYATNTVWVQVVNTKTDWTAITNTETDSATITNTETDSVTITNTETDSATITNTETDSTTITNTETDSATITNTETDSVTVTTTETDSATVTTTETDSATITNTETDSVTITNTETDSVTITNTDTTTTTTTIFSTTYDPCPKSCSVSVETVNVYFWPTDRPYTYPSTYVDPTMHYTFTSPSVYLYIPSAVGINTANQPTGPSTSRWMLPLNLWEVSTIAYGTNMTRQLTLADLGTDCPKTADPTAIATMVDSRCDPILAAPHQVSSWAYPCNACGRFGMFDPPYAVPALTGSLVLPTASPPPVVITSAPPPPVPTPTAPTSSFVLTSPTSTVTASIVTAGAEGKPGVAVWLVSFVMGAMFWL